MNTGIEPRMASGCALQLLERSIQFGHGRLAVVRLSIAAQAGADIPEPQWRYCRGVADACADHTLQALMARAERAARTRATAAAPAVAAGA